MKFIDRHTRTIYDANDKKQLVIPRDSLLNDIVLDLWSAIIGYMDYHQFIIGKKKLGYRKIGLDEFNDKKHDFLKYYNKNNGIDTHGNFLAKDNVIQIKNSYVFINNCVLYFSVDSYSNKMKIANYIFNPIQENKFNYCYMTPHLNYHNTILVPNI